MKEKYKVVYEGPIRKAYIKNLKVNGKINIANTVIKKDALFYKNPFGVLICLNAGEVYPDIGDAYQYVENFAQRGYNDIDCKYINEHEFVKKKVTKEEFKKLVKEMKTEKQ